MPTQAFPSHPTTPRPWQPSIAPEDQGPWLQLLHELAHAVPAPGTAPHGISLAGGEAGLALFHAYYHLAGFSHPGHDHRALAEDHITCAVEALPNLGRYSGFYAGFTGVAWAVDHLQALGLIEADEDFNEAIDQALLRELTDLDRPGLCELIGGVSGLGVYALEAHHRASRFQIMDAAVKALAARVEWVGDQATWFNAPEALHVLARQAHPNGCYNLGLSHGVPGAVAFLAEAATLGIEEARPLAEGGMRWLLAQRRPSANGCDYSYTVEDATLHGDDKGRLAWCYGDLGVAAALLIAARRLGHAEWEREALDLARKTTRHPFESSGVVDAGICHGAFGNAHIFNRFWQATGEACFLDASHHWMKVGLEMRRPDLWPGGYAAWHPAQPDEAPRSPWEHDEGLLEGLAGIGLVILSAISHLEPTWDRFLLTNLPSASH